MRKKTTTKIVLQRRGRPSEPHVLESWGSRAADQLDRRARLIRDFIADTEWKPEWRKHVATVERFSADWPAIAASLCSEARSDRLAWHSASETWRLNFVVPTFDCLLRMIPLAVVPEASIVDLPCVALDLPEATTSAAARAQFLEQRAAYVRFRLLVRDGNRYRRRAELREELTAAAFRVRQSAINDFCTRVDRLIGHPAEARQVGERIRTEMLVDLGKVAA